MKLILEKKKNSFVRRGSVFQQNETSKNNFIKIIQDEEQIELDDGFDVSELAKICTPEVIENCPYYTNGNDQERF